jgi:RNA polymerase II subunit A-like phosphatase
MELMGRSVDVCEVEEDCAHTVQYLGMCTNCGKDMTM